MIPYDLEQTQEIARVAFDDPLEETQRIDAIPPGTWKVRAPIGTSGPCWVRAPHLSEAAK